MKTTPQNLRYCIFAWIGRMLYNWQEWLNKPRDFFDRQAGKYWTEE